MTTKTTNSKTPLGLLTARDAAHTERYGCPPNETVEWVAGIDNELGERCVRVHATTDADAIRYAAEIAAAVNSHAELVKALRTCVSVLETVEPEVRGGYSPDGALASARALLAKVGG